LSRPLVIAHRGASGERPEHTRSAYDLAIAQGCDFIEPDLVISRDGVLIVRHENEISETTDVADHPAFADRRMIKTIDGRRVEGWFTEDLTLTELKTLRCRERLPQLRPGNTRYDGVDEILTLEEAIAIARDGSVGLYLELKHPTYFAGLGLPMEATLAAMLRRHGLDGPQAPVIVECFESTAVKAMGTLTGVRLGQLIAAEGAPFDAVSRREALTYAEMITPRGLAAIAAYAHAIGPEKTLIWPWDGPETSLIGDAHAAGLLVHPWTFRAENPFLPPAFRREPSDAGDLAGELRRAVTSGADGVFCDYPAVARDVIDAAKRD
jgi:glycerophosphoryl diester phosphodiesterase